MKINGGENYSVHITIYDINRIIHYHLHSNKQYDKLCRINLKKAIHTIIKIKVGLRYSYLIFPTQKPNDIIKAY